MIHLEAEESLRQTDDSMTGKTTFLSSSGFEIEFLTLSDRTMSPALRVPGMSIGAEALSQMALYEEDELTYLVEGWTSL